MARKPPPFLSSAWWNDRVINVMDKLEVLLVDRALGTTLQSGYLPLETPATPELLRRMTPQQFAGYLSTLPSIEEKVAAIEKLGRVPPSVLPRAKDVQRTTFA